MVVGRKEGSTKLCLFDVTSSMGEVGVLVSLPPYLKFLTYLFWESCQFLLCVHIGRTNLYLLVLLGSLALAKQAANKAHHYKYAHLPWYPVPSTTTMLWQMEQTSYQQFAYAYAIYSACSVLWCTLWHVIPRWESKTWLITSAHITTLRLLVAILAIN